MTVVNPKSISGINSITTGSGSDDILTIHNNNGTERLRVDSTGATKIVTGIVTTLTATDSAKVGTGVTLSSDGDVFATGVCTATSFSGDGSNLTGISAGVSLSGSTNNTVCTVTGSNAIQGESNVHIDSTGRLLVGTGHDTSRDVGDVSSKIQIEGAGYNQSSLSLMSNAGASAGNTPHLTLGKSRGSSNGDNTIVADGDALGQIQFAGSDGTDCNSVAAIIIGRVDGTPGSNDMPGRLEFKTTSDGAATSTERMRVDSTGDVTISDGDLVIGTDGHGIDFSATSDGSGSSQAEILDDYEEGEWTPTINVGTFSVFVTCKYVKIGRFVKVNGGLIFNNTTDSATVQISGLPFAGDGSQFVGNVWLRRTNTSDKKYIAMIGQSGNSIISYHHDSNGNDMGGAIAYSNFDNSSTYNNFSISYFTNS